MVAARFYQGAIEQMQSKEVPMFPMSNINGNYPNFCSDQQAYNNNNKPFFNDITTNSKQQEALLPSFHLPYSPFNIISSYDLELENNDVFLHQNHDLILLHHQQDQPTLNNSSINTTSAVSETVVTLMDSNIHQPSKIHDERSHDTNITTIDHDRQIPRKRGSKRDRHSKINTAQGPRDRRMRLSLKVARDFFDLQDKLGFDKPSKTIEWLLIQANAEIRKLSANLPQVNYSSSIGTKSASSTSECEVVSGIDKSVVKKNISKPKPSLSVKTERNTRPSRKTAFRLLPRESREKARARARERTKKLLQSRRINESKEATNHELSQLGCCNWSPFEIETGEESGTQSHNMNPSMEVLAEVEALSSQQEQFGTTESMIDDSFAINMGKWSPLASFSHLDNPAISQEHQFTDLQSLCKPWEAYNNIPSL